MSRRNVQRLSCGLIFVLGLSLLPAASAVAKARGDATAGITQQAFVRAAAKLEPGGAGLSSVTVVANTDRSLTVTGTLDGAPFLLRFPPAWNHQLVLYAHGYVAPGTPGGLSLPAIVNGARGILTTALAEGYAYGYSAYTKTGYAVRAGIQDTELLRRLTALVAPVTRTYIVGESMGGDVLMGLIERYPREYAGALPFCGVVAGWYEEVRYLFDFRLVYDYFTRPLGSPIALPGAGHALVPDPQFNILSVADSVGTLFTLAAKKPAYAAVVAQIARVTGANPDPVSFGTALGTAAVGLADYLQTAGGNGYSNVGKVYLGSDDDVALNQGIERVAAVAAASAYLRNAYTPADHFRARVLSIHNLVDPLVPYQQEAILAARVEAQHNGAHLVQQMVDAAPPNASNPLQGGPIHCFFTVSQFAFAWNELRDWVEHDVRPHNDLNITHK